MSQRGWGYPAHRTDFSQTLAIWGIETGSYIFIPVIGHNQMIEAELDRFTAIRRTCHVQMRPAFMTFIVACVGLLPASLSTGRTSPGCRTADHAILPLCRWPRASIRVLRPLDTVAN